MIRWSYGVCTVHQRKGNLLDQTLASLKAAGFDQPRLFVDGPAGGYEGYGLPATYRGEPIRAYGNWVLALAELYLRDSTAERYALFQDDLLCVKGLRAYLDGVALAEKTYWNLYTFPVNHLLANGRSGWYASNQLGKGAVGLVFTRKGVVDLLANQHMVARPQDAHRGWKNIDGAVITALKNVGYTELVHNPSLTQHIGLMSVIGNKVHPQANSFPGENFDVANWQK